MHVIASQRPVWARYDHVFTPRERFCSRYDPCRVLRNLGLLVSPEISRYSSLDTWQELTDTHWFALGRILGPKLENEGWHSKVRTVDGRRDLRWVMNHGVRGGVWRCRGIRHQNVGGLRPDGTECQSFCSLAVMFD